MDLFKIRPVVPDAVIKDPRKDLKNALSIEQFKAGREAVFFPDGLNWEYLPYREIKAVGNIFLTGRSKPSFAPKPRTPQTAGLLNIP